MADVALVPLQEQIAGATRTPLLVLLAAVGCLVVIACANLANLLLAHVSGRRRELAVHAALAPAVPRWRCRCWLKRRCCRLPAACWALAWRRRAPCGGLGCSLDLPRRTGSPSRGPSCSRRSG